MTGGASDGRSVDAAAAEAGLTESMPAVAERRLKELQAELAVGERELQEGERRLHELRETMLRISGAIQVLQEVLASPR